MNDPEGGAFFITFVVEYPFLLACFFLSFWADPRPRHIGFDSKR